MTSPDIGDDLRVECYAGYRGAETPRRFFLGDREITVAAVLGRWRTPTHHCFRVRGTDGISYLLRHDPAADAWEALPARKVPPPHE